MSKGSKPDLIAARRRSIFDCALVLAWTLLAGSPARADQIVLLVDEHGHKVYINTGGPGKSPADWSRSFRPSRGLRALPPSPEIDTLVEKTANRLAVDPELIHAIIQVESEYNPKAVSRKGAMGLMQLIPATAERFGVGDPFDPKQNVEGGVNYLRYLLDLFGGDLSLSLAAYNAGEHMVLRRGGIPSISETQDYVRKVTNRYRSAGGTVPAKQGTKQLPKAPIVRYVDAQGTVHYTNVE